MASKVEFSVPRVPPTINALSRHHWSYRVGAKKTWTEELTVCVKNVDKRVLKAWADMGEKVKVTIHVAHTRLFDPDNLYSAAKIPCDAMVTMGYLSGDKSSDIELLVTQEVAKHCFTKFTIARLEPCGD